MQVVLQFTFATILIISTIVVTQQIKHGQNRVTGCQIGQLAYQWITGELGDKYPLVKNELIGTAAGTSVTNTGYSITDQLNETNNDVWEGNTPNEKIAFIKYSKNESLVKTRGLKLTQPRPGPKIISYQFIRLPTGGSNGKSYEFRRSDRLDYKRLQLHLACS